MSLRPTFLGLFLLGASVLPMPAVDLYGTSATAQSVALGGIFSGSTAGPTDMLASNPAALSALDGRVLEASGLLVVAAGDYRNKTGVPGSLTSSTGMAPSAAFGTPLGNSRWSAGAAIVPVSMLSGAWRYMDPVGAAGASYGMQTNKSAFLALQTTFGAAYRVSDSLSLGASFGILYNRNTLHTPYIFQNDALTGLKTLLDLHTAGTGYNGTFGIAYRPAKAWQFDAAYKTRTTVRSTGTASGNAGEQFAVLGLPFQPAFRYRAEVDNVFPQSAMLHAAWQAEHRLMLHAQGDWTNWHNAFVSLPVHLTEGSNADINNLLRSTSLDDSIPLRWRNQLALRAGATYSVSEKLEWMAGYAHVNSPVPQNTLTPLTADITQGGVSTGVSYHPGRYRFGIAYQVNLPATRSVGKSLLESGEYDDTRTRLWMQTVVLTTALRW